MKIYQGFVPNDEAVIAEMSDTGANIDIDVPVEQSLIDSMKEGDKNPLFVTIEVLSEGVSRNGRTYTKEAIANICSQINSKRPEGYMGHIPIAERASKFPEPQVIWLGAIVKEVGGKQRLFAKGYVLPEAKVLRSWLVKAKAAKKNVAVSIYGAVKAATKGALNMANMTLESIDFARPGSEGVRNMGFMTVTSEMTDDKPDKGEDMKRNEVFESATVSELREHVPEAVISEMITSEVAEVEAERTELVSEMTDIRTSLGMDEKSEKSVVDVISEMREKNRDLELKTELRTKVDNPSARTIIETLVVSEMKDEEAISETVDRVLGSERGKAVIAEMLVASPKVAPVVDKPASTARKYTTKKK